MNSGLIYPAHWSFRGSDGWIIMLEDRRQVLFPVLPIDPSQDTCPAKRYGLHNITVDFYDLKCTRHEKSAKFSEITK